MLSVLENDQKIIRIKSEYGDRIPRVQWYLLGIDDEPYMRQIDPIEHLFFGSSGAGPEGMRLFMGDTPELKGQIVLRIMDAPQIITEIPIEGKIHPLFRIGDDDQDDDDGPQPVILLADSL